MNALARPLDDVIDRIRKLVALARGGATEAEAEQAMRAAHEFVARHNLDLEEVLAGPGGRLWDDRRIEKVDLPNAPWERPVWTTTASLYFCEHYFSQGSRATWIRHNLVGRPHNILVTRLMVDYFLKTIRRLARQHGAKEPAGERASFVHSFRVACARRLSDRIWERCCETQGQETVAESGTRLPALRSLYTSEYDLNRAYLDDMGIELKSARTRTRVTNVLGEMAGKQAADEIGLDKQIRTSRAGRGGGSMATQTRFEF